MSHVPFFDLKRQYAKLRDEMLTAIGAVCEKAAFSDGEFVWIFEKDFARYCGVEYARGVNNGTSALHLALLSLGVGRGDEVIVPSHTFIASAWGISYVGATPVFIDCAQDTWEIDPAAVEKAITKKTKAIIAVHLYGVPCEIGELKKIAKKHKLFLIEDCAQAHGALYKDRMVGTFGEVGCFSFYPSKNLGAYGEAGAIITDNAKVAAKVMVYRNQGGNRKYFHETIGFNMRMEGIQAAVLSVKLRHLDAWNKKKALIAEKYRKGITNPRVTLQKIPVGVQPAFHLFVITTPERNRFMEFLNAKGVDTALHYPVPCHLQEAYKSLGYKKGDLPNTEYVAAHCVSLPLFPELTDGEVDRVIDAINSYA